TNSTVREQLTPPLREAVIERSDEVREVPSRHCTPQPRAHGRNERGKSRAEREREVITKRHAHVIKSIPGGDLTRKTADARRSGAVVVGSQHGVGERDEKLWPVGLSEKGTQPELGPRLRARTPRRV